MNENQSPIEENPIATEEVAPKPKSRYTWWNILIMVCVAIAAVGLTTWSIVQYETIYADKYAPLIDIPTPAYTGSDPQYVDDLMDACYQNFEERIPSNNLVLVVTPCGNTTLDNEIIEITVKAGSNIRSKENIYVGVYILPQDDSLDHPTVYLRLFTEATKDSPITLRSDITENRINKEYLDRVYKR